GGIEFEGRLLVRPEGGRMEIGDTLVTVSGADAATVILAGATNYVNFRDLSADPIARNDSTISAVRSRSFEELREARVADHQELSRRVSLALAPAPDSLPTDERVLHFREGIHPALAALLFRYGRYLLIASSRPGTQPANLQGIWNDSNEPAWDSKYTVNINTEM